MCFGSRHCARRRGHYKGSDDPGHDGRPCKGYETDGVWQMARRRRRTLASTRTCNSGNFIRVYRWDPTRGQQLSVDAPSRGAILHSRLADVLRAAPGKSMRPVLECIAYVTVARWVVRPSLFPLDVARTSDQRMKIKRGKREKRTKTLSSFRNSPGTAFWCAHTRRHKYEGVKRT